MALVIYPKLEQDVVDRQGQAWWACDEENCANEVQITSSEVPEGWKTSDPENFVLRGAAQFCPEHSDMAPPEAEQPPRPVLLDPADLAE